MTTIKSDDVADETKPLTRLIVSKTSKVDDDPNSLDTVIRWERTMDNEKILNSFFAKKTFSSDRKLDLSRTYLWAHFSARLTRLSATLNWVIKMNFLYIRFSSSSLFIWKISLSLSPLLHWTTSSPRLSGLLHWNIGVLSSSSTRPSCDDIVTHFAFSRCNWRKQHEIQ